MGKALVIGFNKWDGMTEDQKTSIQRKIDLKLTFLDYATQLRVSALHGTGVGDLFDAACLAYDSSIQEFPSAQVTRTLEKLVEKHQPPLIKGRRIKLKFAHQHGINPPSIVIHGNQTHLVPTAYKRYLINQFRKEFGLSGTPLKLIFKASHNPFAERKKAKLESYADSKKKQAAKKASKS
jgi:GTP-binding protein